MGFQKTNYKLLLKTVDSIHTVINESFQRAILKKEICKNSLQQTEK